MDRGEHFIINIGHVHSRALTKILFGERPEKSLDVRDGKNVFEIIDKQEHDHMLLAVPFVFRGRQQVVLGIVVDHGLGQDLVVFITLGIFQLIIHESGDLVHIEIDIRHIFHLDVVDGGDDIEYLSVHFFGIGSHFCHLFLPAVCYNRK